MSSQRIVSKHGVLLLCRTKRRRASGTLTRVAVDRGGISLQTLDRKCVMLKPSVDVVHDLKIVWVQDMLDDEPGHVKNCFVVITPEQSYILQATSHRTKIDWMQSLSIAISQSLKFRGSYRPRNWNNLDDLEKWLTVRNVEYQYVEQESGYRGAVYTGKWNMGMPHICGSMKWSNGERYDGEFQFGKFHGAGTRLWLADKKRSYTGNWQDGKMEGYGEMTYTDHSVYSGWWHLGRRHGHGRMEYSQRRCVYIGSWKNDLRCGYGVYDNEARGERYLGMWKSDRYHGAGILVAENMFFYSGVFSNGEKTVSKNSGRIRPGAKIVIQDDKWEPLFQCCTVLLEQIASVSHSTPDWNSSVLDKTSHSASTSDADSAVAMDFSEVGGSPDVEASCQVCHAELRHPDEDCVVCRIQGFKSTDHPLGLLVNTLTRCFTESYCGVAEHKNLLPHAIGELTSITARVHHLVKRYCPSVITADESSLYGKPRSQLSLLLKSNVRRRSSLLESGGAQSGPSWLYPILLPSIFTTLFPLYKEYYHEEDRTLAEILGSLETKSDTELFETLDTYRDYNQQWQKIEMDEVIVRAFSRAVHIFQGVSQFLTPLNKLLCVQEANTELVQVTRRLSHDTRDCSPSYFDSENQQEMNTTPTSLLSLVIIRSHVSHLCSEVQFIQDFAGTTLLRKEYGFLLTQLKESYYQLSAFRKERLLS